MEIMGYWSHIRYHLDKKLGLYLEVKFGSDFTENVFIETLI